MGCRYLFLMLFSVAAWIIPAGCAGPGDTAGDESATVETPESFLAALPGFVETEFRRSGLPGLSFALVQGNRIVYCEAFGRADLEAGTPVTTATVFPAGSLTKLFTATLLLQLAEEGVVDLDTPLVELVPEYRIRSPYTDSGPTTLRQLATHTSGLPRNANVDFAGDFATVRWVTSGGAAVLDGYPSRPEVLASLSDMTLVHPPGGWPSYSNLGYTLLGVGLERAAGAPLAVCIRERLLRPLGMDSSGFRSQLPTVSPRVECYLPAAGAGSPRRVPAWEMGASAYAGGLQTTAEDMARFLMLQFGARAPGIGEVVSGAGLRAMHLDGTGWGFVWDPRHRAIEHSGGHVGYHAYVRAYPDLAIGVVALANANNPLEERRPAADMARSAILRFKAALEAEVDAAGPDTALDRYLGSYVLSGTTAGIDVELRNGLLVAAVRFGEGMELFLHPEARNVFTVSRSPGHEFVFEEDDSEAIDRLEFMNYTFLRERD